MVAATTGGGLRASARPFPADQHGQQYAPTPNRSDRDTAPSGREGNPGRHQAECFTPGPWRLASPPGVHLIQSTSGDLIATIRKPESDGPSDPIAAAANAMLIAAAPDLLAALDRLRNVAELQGADIDEGSAIEQAHTAIRKARGRL